MASTDAVPPPPLERLLPYIIGGVSAAFSVFSAIATLTSFTFSLISRSISCFSPLPIILYFLAPVIVFFDILTDVFVRWPHTIALYLLDAFYPIYVFCGVAVIVGLLIGLTGRLVATVLVDLVVGPQEKEIVVRVKEEEEGWKSSRRSRRKAKVTD